MAAVAVAVSAAMAACGGGSSNDAGRSADTTTTVGAEGGGADSSLPSESSTTTTIVAASGQCGLHGSYPEAWPERPRYDVDLDIDPVGGTVTGNMRVRFTPPEVTDRLVFRLWANVPRAGEAGGRLDVGAVLVDGVETNGEYQDGGAGPSTPGTIYILTRPEGFAADRAVRVELAFTLRMPGAVNERVAQVGDSLRLGSVIPMLSWVRGRGWHTAPAVSNFSEAVSSEVADYDVTTNLPDGYTTLATGEEIAPGHFVASAVRDWAATVGRLEIAQGTADNGRIRVVVGAADGTGDDPQRRLGDAIAALDDFSARYGPYPYPVLTMGVTGSLSGGIEFPQHIFIGGGTSRDHLIHEVAHMWFYGLVGNDQYADPWLDEGLTEYAEAQFLGETGGMRSTSIPADARGRVGESHAFWQSHTNSFYRGVYVQGAQAIAALSDAVGGLDVVDCALRRFVLDNAFQVAAPTDLVTAIERQTAVDPRPTLERFGAI